MTIRELVTKLQQYPQDVEVQVAIIDHGHSILSVPYLNYSNATPNTDERDVLFVECY